MPNQSNGNTDLAEILEILQMRMCSQDDNFPDFMFKITLYFYRISITVSLYRKILFELRSARFSFISMFLRLTLTSVEKDMNQPAFNENDWNRISLVHFESDYFFWRTYKTFSKGCLLFIPSIHVWFSKVFKENKKEHWSGIG